MARFKQNNSREGPYPLRVRELVDGKRSNAIHGVKSCQELILQISGGVVVDVQVVSLHNPSYQEYLSEVLRRPEAFVMSPIHALHTWLGYSELVTDIMTVQIYREVWLDGQWIADPYMDELRRG